MPSFSLGRGTLLGVGYIRVEADTAAAETKLGALGKGLAIGATGFLALTAAAAASVDAASHFNTEMLKVQTQAGGTAADVKTLSNQILSMKNVQFSPDQLAEAMYHLKSVGLDNVTAMKDLRVAQDLAAVGGSKLEDTTNALAGAWRSGIKGAQDMGQAAATVNAIIGAGNMRMSDFVSAIGTGILPSAKTFGLSLGQVGAALALMTDEGIPAVDAATRLRMSFSLLGAPSKAADGQLRSIGLTGLQLGEAMRSPGGLISAIQLLKDHLDASGMSAAQQAQVLSRAFGGGRSSSAILTMINNLDVLRTKQDQVNNSLGKFPAAVAAQAQTLSAQSKMLVSTLEQIGIKIGETLIGPVTAFVGFLNATAIPALERFAGSLSKPLASIGGIISGVSSSGFLQALIGPTEKRAPRPKAAPAPVLPILPPRSNQYQAPVLNLSAGPLTATAPFTQGYGAPTTTFSGNPLNIPAPRTGYFPSPVAIPLTAPVIPKGTSDLAKVGKELHDVLKDLAPALSDTAKAAGNLAQALTPFVSFLGSNGLKVLGAFASVLAHDIAPALVTVTGFLKDNSGIVRDLLIVYLTPLAAKMTYMSTIKTVGWFYDLAKSVVMFPIQQIGAIKESIQGFTAAGGALDGAKLRLMYIGDALKTGATNALTFAKNMGTAIAEGAASAWSSITSGASAAGSAIATAASNAVTLARNVGTAIASGAASAWSGVVSGASAVGGAISSAAAATWEFVTASAAATAGAIKQAAAFVADKVAELGAAIAEGAMTAAEWLLNVAMMANPIVLIVAGIALLVAAIVWVATKTTWFQTIWGVVWGGVKDAALAAWHFLDTYVIHPIATSFSWLWTNAIQPALRFIVVGFLNMVDSVLKAAVDLVSWVPGIGGQLKGVVKSFEAMKDGINAQLGGIKPKTVPVTITFNGVPQGQITGHTYTSTTGFSYATGGRIPMSVGTPGRDSVPILAMPGEFVVNTKATSQNLGLLQKINAGQMKGYARGGMVGFDNAISADMALAERTDIRQETTKIVSAYVKANNAFWANMAAGAGAGGTIPSGSHLAIINAALAAAGVPPPGTLAQWQLGLNTLIGRESGWNPSAINLTDINAQMGDPSRGLAQTIMSTFLAYVPGALRSRGIFDPVANVAAAVRYIVSRYGSITSVQQANPSLPPMGYDAGGLARRAGVLAKYTALPERVLSPRQTAAFETMVGALDRGSRGRGGSHSGGDTYVFNFSGPVGSRRELENWFVETMTSVKRNGRLVGLVG